MGKVGLENVASHVNPFWKDILLNWAKLIKNEGVEPHQILSQSIWLNPYIKVDGKVLLNYSWVEKGIFFINDIIKENGSGLMTVDELNRKYILTNSHMLYNSIISSIPREWKIIIKNEVKVQEVTNVLYEKIKNLKKPSRWFYSLFLETFSEVSIQTQHKWEFRLNSVVENWERIYTLSSDCIIDNKIKNFQFKLLHNIVPTNTFLNKCKLCESELCSFCGETRETVLHIFCECNVVKNIWLLISNRFQERCGLTVSLSICDIILGINDIGKLFLNTIMLLTKYYIFSCKYKKVYPSFSEIISVLKTNLKIERF